MLERAPALGQERQAALAQAAHRAQKRIPGTGINIQLFHAGGDLAGQLDAGNRGRRGYPADPASIAEALVAGVAPDRDRLRDMRFRRAGEFTWAAAAASTLDVYREVAERRRRRRA
jgi:glycosyltransferase involved in cell wall biosynthesis